MSHKTDIGGAGPSINLTSDNNQPMDLAQKSHSLRIPEPGGGLKGVVHFASVIPPKSTSNVPHVTTSKLGSRADLTTSPAGLTIVSRPSQALITGSSAGLNLTSGQNSSLRGISHPPSLTISTPVVSGPPPTAHSGYHIPRGPAFVANMSASRSQNISSIVRTTPQNFSGPTVVTSSGTRSTSGQRVIPVSTTGSTWLTRATPTSVLSKIPTVAARAGVVSRTHCNVPNTSMYGNSGKPLASQTVPKPSVQGSMRSGIDGIRMQLPKVITSNHPISTPKYTSGGVISSNRTIMNSANDNMYAPSSSLVTSLASSGTTITPHAVSRGQSPAIAVRITSAGSSSSQVSVQSSAFGGTSGHHPRSLDHHIPVKTPIVRSPYSSGMHHGKVGSSSLPNGAQITYPGSKLVAPSHGSPALSLTQIATVSSKSNVAAVPSISSATPYHSSKSGAALSAISRLGTSNHSLTRVLASPGTHSHSLTPSTGVTIVGPSHSSSSDVQFPQSGVIRHRSVQVPSATTRNDRANTHYITPPYFKDPSSPISYSTNQTQNLGHHIPPSNHASRSTSTPLAKDEGHSPCLPTLKTIASPRPSILRKRPDLEGLPMKAAKNLSASLCVPLASPPSPKRPESRGHGNISSGSTTLSANSSPDNQCVDEDHISSAPRIISHKIEPSSGDDSQTALMIPGKTPVSCHAENGFSAFNHVPLNIPQLMDGVSPRKKPRKQQLTGNELQEGQCLDQDFMMNTSKRLTNEMGSIRLEQDYEPITYSPPEASPVRKRELSKELSPEPEAKRPHMSLIKSCKKVWKSRHNHFNSHTEIKPKDDKKKTVNEIANQKAILERVNGWKVAHLIGQVDDLVETEDEAMGKLNSMLGLWDTMGAASNPKEHSKDMDKVSELIKSNIQRSKTIMTQMSDARVQMNKLFDHKHNIVDILGKYSNKRSIRRREKT